MLRLGKTIDYPSFSLDSGMSFTYHELDRSVYHEVVTANKLHLNDIALIFMGKSITYKNLIAQADRVADILASMNIRKGEMILLGSNSPQAVSILLACSKIGVGAMILTERTTKESFAHTVADIDIPLMFCSRDVYTCFSEDDAVDELSQVVILPYDTPIGDDATEKPFSLDASNVCTWDSFLNHRITERAEEIAGGYFPLTISASTGSNGAPKGIVMENKSYIAMKKMVRRARLGWHRGDVVASTLSVGVVSGTSFLLLVPLMMGMTVLQTPRIPGINPFGSFLESASKYLANIVVSPPSLWLAMIGSHPETVDFSNVKHAYTVGESLSASEYSAINGYLKRCHATDQLRNMYGMSEVNSTATFAPYNLIDPLCAGVAMPYCLISVFDHDTLEEKKFGETGEVFILTPAAMREYLYDPKETKQSFMRDDLGRKWVRTGDLGVMNERGELTILGRISQRHVTPQGNSIYPYMIENILLSEPSVGRIKMVNVTLGGKKTYALHIIPASKDFSQLANASENAMQVSDATEKVALVSDKALADCLFNKLKDSSVLPALPGLIKFRDSFPKNAGGKTDIKKLEEETDGFIYL